MNNYKLTRYKLIASALESYQESAMAYAEVLSRQIIQQDDQRTWTPYSPVVEYNPDKDLFLTSFNDSEGNSRDGELTFDDVRYAIENDVHYRYVLMYSKMVWEGMHNNTLSAYVFREEHSWTKDFTEQINK